MRGVYLLVLALVILAVPLAAQVAEGGAEDPEAPVEGASILVTTTTGRVQYQRDATSWRSLVSGRPAPLATAITTRADASAVFDVAGTTVEIGPLTTLRFVLVSPEAITVELRSGTLVVSALGAATVVTVTSPRGTVRSVGALFRLRGDRVDGVGPAGVVTATSVLGHPRRVWSGEVVLLAPLRPVPAR